MYRFSGRDNEFRYENRSRKTDTNELWIVPYADFMTVLMVLFLIMFAFAYSSRMEQRYSNIIVSIQKEMGGKVRSDLLTEVQDLERTQQAVLKFDDALAKKNLARYITVSMDTENIRISLNTPVLFASGQAALRSDSRMILHEVATIIKGLNNEVVVEGHTDNVPIRGTRGKYRSNWELSQSRALAVIDYMIRKEGVSPGRFAAAGYGEFRPLYPNDTDEHRSYNRRIEINIIRTTDGGATARGSI